MPYFENIKVLFIHIPKTGGMNVENYLFLISNSKPSIKNLVSYFINPINIKINNHSLQHLTFCEIYDLQSYFNINFNKIKIFTVVRNPYDRIISDLLFLNIINDKSSKKNVEDEIRKYINSPSDYDNHKTLQYKFILDKDGNVNKNIIVLKTENLNTDMINLGYSDFEKFCNFYKSSKNYYIYLNHESIKMINSYYKKDFEYFNYKIL